MWLASKLPLVLDRQTLDELTTAMGQVSTSSSCGEKDRKGCPPAASRLSQAADVRQSAAPPAAIGRDMQAASTTSWLGTKKDSKATSRSPVVWLEEPNALGVIARRRWRLDQRCQRLRSTPRGGPRDTQTGWKPARIQARPRGGRSQGERGGRHSRGRTIWHARRNSKGRPFKWRGDSDFSVHVCGTTKSDDFVSQPIDGRASCQSRPRPRPSAH